MGDDHIGLEAFEVQRISLHFVRIAGCKEVIQRFLALLVARSSSALRSASLDDWRDCLRTGGVRTSFKPSGGPPAGAGEVTYCNTL